MTLALVISAAAAWFTAGNEAMLRLVFGGRFNFFLFAIGEIALVWWLSASIGKISTSAAIAGFIGYSVLNGITLSSIFIVYTGASIASVFVSCAGMFAVMSVYGLKTKSDLRSAGRYLMMAVFGIIIASLINLLLRSNGLDWLISIVTVVVFTGLTAYDSQKMLAVSEQANSSEMFKKVAIIGALELYLDFINMFLALLRLFGRRR
jgi:FtsH-binding integral membrane protein